MTLTDKALTEIDALIQELRTQSYATEAPLRQSRDGNWVLHQKAVADTLFIVSDRLQSLRDRLAGETPETEGETK